MDCSAVNVYRFCWDCIYPRFSRERWILKVTIMDDLKIITAIGWGLAIISPFVWRYIFNKWDDKWGNDD